MVALAEDQTRETSYKCKGLSPAFPSVQWIENQLSGLIDDDEAARGCVTKNFFIPKARRPLPTKPSWPWAAKKSKYPKSARQHAASRPRTCQLASLCAIRVGGTNNAVIGKSRELVAGLDEDSCGNAIRKSRHEVFAYAVHTVCRHANVETSILWCQPYQFSKCQLTHSAK